MDTDSPLIRQQYRTLSLEQGPMAGLVLRDSLSECQQEANMEKRRLYESSSRERPWPLEHPEHHQDPEAVQHFLEAVWGKGSSDRQPLEVSPAR